MFLVDNPVLQRELLVNLRMKRAFLLLLVYIALLGLVVYTAWPNQAHLDLSNHPPEAKRLVNLFFLGQFALLSLMVPSFAAGTITGEKERQTYEMLLASPMRPAAVVLGKLLAALCHLAVLVFCSLPIVMLCLPLGGKSPYEVLAAYGGMAAAVTLFGMICIAASSYFTRTIAALVVSYLVILPLTLVGILFYKATSDNGFVQVVMIGFILPAACLGAAAALLTATSRRLLYPPDVGAEAKDVVDPDFEQKMAVGMVIRSDQFPDKLFAPAKRHDLMADGVNPIFDKEMRSELFGQGTLMLRLVIQLSMLLALPLMAVCLYIQPAWAPWYACYVVLFNVLVGPVFSAPSITSERERQTLELLLTTTVSPWHILTGKLLSGLRVSSVLTAFIIWPLFLAWLLPPWTYLRDTPTILCYLVIVVLTALTTTTLAMFCSVIFSRTSVSMMTTYVLLLLLFAAPVAAWVFAQEFSPPVRAALASGKTVGDWNSPVAWLQWSTATSPISAAFSLPLTLGEVRTRPRPLTTGGRTPPRGSSRFMSCSTRSSWGRCSGYSIAAGVCGPKLSPPRRFALISAASAARNSDSALSFSLPPPLNANPALAVIFTAHWSPAASAARLRTRSTIPAAAALPGTQSKRPNSSPPSRATTSSCRRCFCKACATACKTRSPAACPRVSLISLNWSRSSTARQSRRSSPASAAWSPFAPRKPRSFAERKATLASATISNRRANSWSHARRLASPVSGSVNAARASSRCVSEDCRWRRRRRTTSANKRQASRSSSAVDWQESRTSAGPSPPTRITPTSSRGAAAATCESVRMISGRSPCGIASRPSQTRVSGPHSISSHLRPAHGSARTSTVMTLVSLMKSIIITAREIITPA